MATDPTPAAEDPNAPWYKLLTRYHWYVLIVAALGWLFDTMDQQIFILARIPALAELLDKPTSHPDVEVYKGYATAIFMIGWATGGLIFGLFGDRFGRVRAMMVTILIYSLFTGLSAVAQSWIDFAIYRFLCGVGVGGEFAAGVTLVAEVMPARARPYALAFLQALSTVGNILASVIALALPATVEIGGWQGWRFMFLIGILPALLVVFIRRNLKEPDAWHKAKQQASGDFEKQMGDLRELFGTKRWRHNAIIGVLLAMAGVMGLWGIAFSTPSLIRNGVVKDANSADFFVPIGLLLQNVGGFFGIYSFSVLANRFGRRRIFAFAFLIAFLSILMVFGFMTEIWQLWWMMPTLGFSTYMVFGGFAVYFPELFPTRMRSTGVGFCYNVARYIGAAAPAAYGLLVAAYATSQLTILSSLGSVDNGVRYAALTIAFVYIFGMMVTPFAPETKDKPLPE